MLRYLKQARAAFSMLNPSELRNQASRTVHIGLVASGSGGYEAMTTTLAPPDLPFEDRTAAMQQIHRASDPNARSEVDLVLYEPGVQPGPHAYTLDPTTAESTVKAILHDHPDLGLPLARQFPVFRGCYVEKLIHTVARENALFAIATALPDVLPSLVELPWAFGEFATDTAFLTANQVRMAFLIGAACGKGIGFGTQKVEVLSIVGSAFGWRALARELAGKIPFGAGLIPKGAIAYAGTVAVGKSLEYYHQANRRFTPEQQQAIYQEALTRGREVAGALAEKPA